LNLNSLDLLFSFPIYSQNIIEYSTVVVITHKQKIPLMSGA